MGTRDPRIDAYIAKSQEFARPILEHLRALVHQAVPHVEETMKWSMPHFTHHGMLAGMAAFKAHCVFGFWNGEAVLGDAAKDGAMGSLGRITSLKDLPPKRELVAYLKKAAALNEAGQGKRTRAPAKRSVRAAKVPDDFAKALAASKRAAAAFDAFPPSHRREYIEWITEAKRPETRARRIAQAVEWIAEGKQRNWKYM